MRLNFGKSHLSAYQASDLSPARSLMSMSQGRVGIRFGSAKSRFKNGSKSALAVGAEVVWSEKRSADKRLYKAGDVATEAAEDY